MPFERPFVARMSEPSERTRWKARPMPPENFESSAICYVSVVRVGRRRVEGRVGAGSSWTFVNIARLPEVASERSDCWGRI